MESPTDIKIFQRRHGLPVTGVLTSAKVPAIPWYSDQDIQIELLREPWFRELTEKIEHDDVIINKIRQSQVKRLPPWMTM